MSVPEPMSSADDGTTLHRAMENDAQPCVWCGAGTWWSWILETPETIRLVGFACSVRCAERRVRRPVA